MRRKRSFKAVKRVLMFAVMVAMMLTMMPMGGAVYAAVLTPDYTITNGTGSVYSVSNGSISNDYPTLSAAVATCTGDINTDGKIIVQFGDLTTPVVTMKDQLVINHSNDLTLTGNLVADSSFLVL